MGETPALPLSYRAVDGGPGGNRTRDDVVSPAFAGGQDVVVVMMNFATRVRDDVIHCSIQAELSRGCGSRIRTGDRWVQL